MSNGLRNRLLACFEKYGRNVDVAITELFECAYPDRDGVSSRNMQQRLGPHITKLNRRFERAEHDAGRIVPGMLKRTYRLVSDA